MREAEQARLIEEDHKIEGFRFRHALTRSAVLGMLVAPERAQLARRALNAFGELAAATDTGRLGLAAQLAETAGDADRAFELRLTSSRAALRLGAVASAQESATEALRLAETPHRMIDARRALLDARVAAGDAAEIAPLGTRLVDQLTAVGAPTEDIAEVHHLLAAAAVVGTDWRRARPRSTRRSGARRSRQRPSWRAARRSGPRSRSGNTAPRPRSTTRRTARAAAVRAGRRELESDASGVAGPGPPDNGPRRRRALLRRRPEHRRVVRAPPCAARTPWRSSPPSMLSDRAARPRPGCAQACRGDRCPRPGSDDRSAAGGAPFQTP